MTRGGCTDAPENAGKVSGKKRRCNSTTVKELCAVRLYWYTEGLEWPECQTRAALKKNVSQSSLDSCKLNAQARVA